MFPTVSIDITDPTQVAWARRAASEMAMELGFDEHDAGRAALLASEAASNIVKHAGCGELLLSPSFEGPELIMTALDKGPGFHAQRALQDGYSTAGTLGGGLGAMRRMSSSFDLYTQPGQGSIVRLVLRRSGDKPPAPGPFEVGAVALPYPGETVCGDAWAMHHDGSSALLIVADGLGHGMQARRASALAIAAEQALNGSSLRSPHDVLANAHQALRSTRGAAVAAAVIDTQAPCLHYAGIGNISGVVVTPQGQKHLMSMAGIVGHNMRKIQPLEHPWTPRTVLVMHSDGLTTHWQARNDPELFSQHPGIIAAALYRDHQRQRDDVTVLVARQRAGFAAGNPES